MCHGIQEGPSGKPLTAAHFEVLMGVAAELGCNSIGYDQLDAWRKGQAPLPPRPVMFDFDHPLKSIHSQIHPILARFGFRGNLFVNTGPMEQPDDECMTWDEIGGLVEAGWHIGAHTVSHPDLSRLSLEDPDGEKLRAELEECDATLHEKIGVRPRDFAFTGTSFSTVARREVERRYRFGRLWITQAHYDVDGRRVRYANLVGVEGEDEPDGGPPVPARYITKGTDPYLLPSMEIQALIYEPYAFRAYLQGAVEP